MHPETLLYTMRGRLADICYNSGRCCRALCDRRILRYLADRLLSSSMQQLRNGICDSSDPRVRPYTPLPSPTTAIRSRSIISRRNTVSMVSDSRVEEKLHSTTLSDLDEEEVHNTLNVAALGCMIGRQQDDRRS
jgi:hypothetical protein